MLLDRLPDGMALLLVEELEERGEPGTRISQEAIDLLREALVGPLPGLQELVGGAPERDRRRGYREVHVHAWRG
jgi:hypothetical protein